MWGQIAYLLVIVAGASALPAISHQSRVDGPGYGYLGYAYGPTHGQAYSVNHGHGYYYHGKNHDYHHAWAYPSYKFAYSVYDPYTGDHKSQAEYRHGDVVKGSYSLAEPGGNIRSVHYSANDIQGFNAVVHHNTVHHYIPHYHH